MNRVAIAALLVLVGWPAFGLTWLLGPFREPPPGEYLDAAPAYALSVGFVLPYLTVTVWVVPCALLALGGWHPRLLLVLSAPVVTGFGTWLGSVAGARLREVYPTLGLVASVMTCTGLVALSLVASDLLPRRAQGGGRGQPTQSPRPPQPPYAP